MEGWLSHNASWIVATTIVAIGWLVSAVKSNAKIQGDIDRKADKLEVQRELDKRVSTMTCSEARRTCKGEIVAALRDGLSPIWKRIDEQQNKHDHLAQEFAGTKAQLVEATANLKEAVAELREANGGD